MHARRLLFAALAAGLFAACESHDPRTIQTGPSFAVRYATQRVSPAVVMLDVVSDTFSGGQSTPVRGIGSGIIIDREGHVLTNFHVAGQASRIEATLADQEHVHARLVGADHWTDLAVVQLDLDEIRAKKLTFAVATLGSSAAVMLGQPVLAVGTPYGLTRTITAGIVSQTDRPLEDSARIDGYETGWFNNWIQTDAAINPGNSGGPLINLRGEVVGINTRAVSDANNLGFAIPIDTAREVAARILANRKVTRSYIGVTLQPMQDLEGFFDVAGNTGVLVSYVEPDSPASRAGIQTADVLLAVNGSPVSARFPEQLAAVRKLISDIPVGEPVQLSLQRGITRTTPSTLPAGSPAVSATGRSSTLEIQVTTARLESAKTPEKAIEDWGITVSDVTRAYLRSARLPAIQGVLVTSLRTGSPADRADMEFHDIIQRVNDREVTSVEELQAAVDQWRREKKQVLVDVSRNRGEVSLVLKP